MNEYESPLVKRYASRDMKELFSPARKFRTWRRLWIALAEVQHELGLPVTKKQVRELKAHADDLNLPVAEKYEAELRHDVMAHIRAYGDQCPGARGVIHLGATSMYVVDNTDLILLREALGLLREEMLSVVEALAAFAKKHAALPTVAFTHFQPAQFTTVGRRACLWLQDFLLDLDDLDARVRGLKFLGAKGATGTQASFLSLFDGDESKVVELDRKVAEAFAFGEVWPLTGQTYSRKVDYQIHALLAGVAQSAHKFSNDMRLLQHLGEILEPFGKKQVGSSAMPYKRNPMKAERTASLSRLVMTLAQNAAFTAASQWFERTLDDSAGKRIVTPEAFLATDAVLNLCLAIASGLEVREDVIRRNVERELPFIASEDVLMAAVRAGGDRQDLHERIRRHAIAAAGNAAGGRDNDLLERLKGDGAFAAALSGMEDLLRPERYTGRSVSQAAEFLRTSVEPRLKGRGGKKRKAEVRV
ncbi:MAG: adenylosuccinate lyase [Planctomycetota bacterium]|jgi:adenylosuccinate lyase